VSAGSEGSHTLVIAGSGTLYLVAVEAVRSSTNGVKVSRIGLSSSECSWLTDDSSAIASRDCYLLTDPDLAIIEFGLNEANNGTTTATYKTNMGALISDIQALGASVLIVAAPPPSTAFISGATWDSFRVAMGELATQYGTGFLDMTDYWVSYTANAAYFADNVHPNDGGHVDMARIVANFAIETVAPSSPVTFAPTDLSNLALGLDADHDASFTFSSGTLVSQWNDRSGNSRHFSQGTAGNQPTRSATVNGLSAVWFDGVDNHLTAGDTMDLGTDSLTVFAVVKPHTTATQGIIGKYKVNPGDGEWILYLNEAKVDTVYDAGTLAIASSSSFTSLDATLLATTIDRAAGSVTQRISRSINGTATFTPDSGTSRNGTRELRIGALRATGDSSFQSGYWLNAYLCEIVVYTRALNSTERDQVEAYLDAKWRLL
jgi:hypothetical protein